jgi:hypothetical protein
VITSSCAAPGTIVFSQYAVGGYTAALAASADSITPAPQPAAVRQPA